MKRLLPFLACIIFEKMKKKVVWLVVSGWMVAALLLTSCAPAVVEEEAKKVAPPVKEEVVVVEEEELIAITFKTVATELQAHKWDVRDQKLLPILNKMESLIREAAALHAEGKSAEVDARVAAYRALYEKNAGVLK